MLVFVVLVEVFVIDEVLLICDCRERCSIKYWAVALGSEKSWAASEVIWALL